MDQDQSVEQRLRRIEDLHQLQQLRAHYCQHLDSGRWDELVELFTENGAFVGLSTARGRHDLKTFFAGLQAGGVGAWWHFSSNETLQVEGDTASGQTWLLQPCVVDGQSQIAAGRYVDRMQRCPDGQWRFEERRVLFFWWSDFLHGWNPGTFVWPPAEVAADDSGVGR